MQPDAADGHLTDTGRAYLISEMGGGDERKLIRGCCSGHGFFWMRWAK